MDELDKLKAALRDAPAPDASKKDATLRMAKENFDTFQGSAKPARPTQSDPKRVGFREGLKTMFAPNTFRPLLLTTSSLVVLGVGFVLVQPMLAPDSAILDLDTTMAPEVSMDLPAAEDFTSATGEIVAQAPARAPAPAKIRTRESAGIALSEAAPRSQNFDFAGGATIIAPAPYDLDDVAPPDLRSRDQFANDAPNPLKITAEAPVSTFSTDVDTASYSVIRRALQNGQLPPRDAVRIEEMVNYFPYDYAAPTGEHPFEPTLTVTGTPWNPDTQLVHIAIQGEMPQLEDRPALNLVFLIDTSGSMNAPDKLPLLIQSFRLMLSELRPEDQVAIVTYAGSAGTVLPPTSASETGKINAALGNLSAGGSTAGEAGLRQAYALASQMGEEGELSRVLLATDGDFNVGMSGSDEMKSFIEEKRDTGTYLSILGFGRGNLNDALMQTLAQNGNGQAAYIDTLSEARKVLVDQLTGALFPIAGDVKVQVEWNPAEVAEYRLIGYETRALKREDFNNDKVDAGDIGAGHTVTALYEITPVGSPAILNTPLRYDTQTVASDSSELGFLRLRYKPVGASDSILIERPITQASAEATVETRFATAIAGFGQLLRGSDYLGDWSYADAIALANEAKGDDPFGYRNEAITLMRLAESLAKAP